MTNEEAKAHMDMLIAHKDKALKTHPYFNGATNMRDATEEERKSVKDYVDSISKPTGVNFNELLRDCKTCIHSDKGNCAYTEECHECMWESKYEQQHCEDCISRQAAIKMVKELSEHHTGEAFNADRVITNVTQLPPVKPQRPKGKWITWKEAGNYIPSETRFECSVCHDAAQTLCNGLDLLSPYCPNCGAKMEVEHE